MIMYKKNTVKSFIDSYDFTTWEKRKNPQTQNQKCLRYCDNIFTFDIETTSCYLAHDGNVEMFDYTKVEKYYRECTKIGFMYVWQFGIDDNIIIGRTWVQFTELIQMLSDLQMNIEIYVHNLGFEFQFLRNCIEFESVFARKPRKPLKATCYKTITFRDSYSLVGLSLKNWAEQKNLPVKKLVGELDYNIMRSPNTPLSERELEYCINDLLVMYHGLKEYREKYTHINKIPLTQTGEIRLEVQDILKTEWRWRKKQADLIPNTLADYNLLMSAYFGGDVHANYKLANKLLHCVTSGDFASSYPWAMVSEMYPLGNFKRVDVNKEFYMHNSDYSYLITFEMTGLVSKLDNTFLSRSRCTEVLLYRDDDGKLLPNQIDNGRIIRAMYIKATFTNIDFEMLQDFYDYNELSILDFRVSKNGYLNGNFRRYILTLYHNKTTLKNIPEQEVLYKKSKQYINGLYGMAVTREFTDEVEFLNDWNVKPTTPDSYTDKYIKKVRRLDKIMLSPQVGIWVTAYARKNLWRGMIAPLDKKCVYFDTDSCKFLGKDLSVFKRYNKGVENKYKQLAKDLKVDVEMFTPKDSHGIKQKLGQIDIEYTADDFKTLGAKKYCYRVGDKIHMTVSGVPKRPENIPKTVNDFSDDLVFPPKTCGKLISNYNDSQPEITLPNGYIMRDAFGICLQPTGYTLGFTKDYATLLINNREVYNHDFDDIF